MSADIITDDGHALFTGTTGAGAKHGGKTTTANWLHDQLQDKGHVAVSVFYNPKGHDWIRGTKVVDVMDMAREYREGTRKFNFVPASDYGDKEHEAVVKFLRRLPGRKLMVHDEAKFYMDNDGMRWALSQGGNMDDRSIRSFVLAQQPWDLPEEYLNLLTWKVYVGPPTKSMERYLKTMDLAHIIEDVRKVAKPYHWVAVSGGEIMKVYKPVPESYSE